LLLEAGGRNADKNMRIDGHRWSTMFNPTMNWGDKSAPQTALNDREIDYPRGKGLGGSSAIASSHYSKELV